MLSIHNNHKQPSINTLIHMPETPPNTSDSPQPAEPTSESDPNLSQDTQTPHHDFDNGTPAGGSHKYLRTVLAIVIIIIAVAAISYALTTNNKQSGQSKKDIPNLTFGIVGSSNITPNYPIESVDTTYTQYIDAQVFEGLVRYQDQNKLVPWLATGWTNPNDTTWVFNLRHGVKFHSGRTMTAADVVYSLNYAVTNQNSNQGSTNLSLASSITQVKALDPYQVQITTNGPDAVLLNRLSYLYILDQKAKLGDPNAGTGPYTINDSTKQSLNLLAFNNYWAGHVYARDVHVYAVSTPDQLATATAAGKYDISGDFDAQQLKTIKDKVKQVQDITVPDLGVSFINLNTERASSPLSSLAARQAISYAVNVPEILKAGGISGTQSSQVIPPEFPGHEPSITATPYNPTKAKQLLASVTNRTVPITLNYPAGDEGQVGAIAKELDAVGFNIKLVRLGDIGTLVNNMLAGQGDMYYLSYTSNTLDGLDMIESIVASSTLNYNNSELTGLVSQASSTLDPTTRIALLQKMERLIAANVPTVPLYSQVRTYTLTKPYVVQVDLPSVDVGAYLSQVYQK